ncbi:MAG: mandelate racemase/muconate lactonizing enzyme family protein [Bryobacter sp.]|jgi:L-alanine-DL-glutamate epimerase-like enolase superfamily enzyme|nr:mandelate racemase/muconate lactonizing enzyme family protein [Bryobacter sp.]
MWSRRTFLAGLAGSALLRRAEAALRKMKITRIRMFDAPNTRPMINQSFHIVTVETDAGITGIGEGGSPDLIRNAGQQLIGQDPLAIDRLWQLMYRGLFYPAGREKLHAMGALDMALWDIKGKALDVPVWQLIGGQAREYCECYATGYPSKGSLRESARDCIAYGFRAYRGGGSLNGDAPFHSHERVRKYAAECREMREGVGPDGDWAIDFHTRFDLPDAVRLCTLIEAYEPYFVEDLVRSENPGVYRQLRPLVKVPIAVGEQFGDKWEINELIEGRLIDYSRVSIPNCGGITEFLKIAALCETHYVGLVPHFTGPIAEAALVHCCVGFSGPVLMEYAFSIAQKPAPFLARTFDFRNGKMYPNERPGLGVEVNTSGMQMTAEIDKHNQPIQVLRRPDGSFTNW